MTSVESREAVALDGVTFEWGPTGALFARIPVPAIQATVTVGRQDARFRWQPVDVSFPGTQSRAMLGVISRGLPEEFTRELTAAADEWEAGNPAPAGARA